MIEELVDEWTDLESSMITGVGVKDDWLIVGFKNGTFYRYRECAPAYIDLIDAESVGKYFHKHIKQYPAQKLVGEEWLGDS